jgi:hypothetical protein
MSSNQIEPVTEEDPRTRPNNTTPTNKTHLTSPNNTTPSSRQIET